MFSEKDYLKIAMSDDMSNRIFVGGQKTREYLRRASHFEKVAGGTLGLILGAAFYIHLDVRPFLPIEIEPSHMQSWILLSFVVMLLSFSLLMIVLLPILYDLITHGLRLVLSGPTCVVCAKCGACTPSSRYFKEKGHGIRGCKKCSSTRVYCGKCGKPASIQDFMIESKCPHCGHPYIMIRET